jgi:hypothetical protein
MVLSGVSVSSIGRALATSIFEVEDGIVMHHMKMMAGAALALVVSSGCGAAEDGAGERRQSANTSPVEAEIAANTELARLEFDDGNVVRFAELNGGVYVSELGSLLNPRHLVPKEGRTAVETFQALAPGREVPVALMQMHERMYPPGALRADAKDIAEESAAETEAPELDPDLEHNGKFQQSFPAANFLAQMCDFPTTSPSYKHTNRTDPHTDTSLNIHSAYYAAGADIGIMTEQACAGKSDSQGFFVGQCNAQTPVQPGFAVSGLYDAGQQCDKSCTLFFGCVSICSPRQVRWELRHGAISSSVRFHECAKLSR